ncbi:MAG: hypothetical protein NTX92_05285, partial [Euryarchaeota archaeon]|nr:hypothetical protein [Euryarchaeota archaeon]
MKKLLVVVLIILTCISMSGFGASLANNFDQNNIGVASQNLTTVVKTSSTTMDQVKESVYSYLNMQENPYTTGQETIDSTITAPWIKPASTLFEWWILVQYNGNAFEKQLDISINDFKQKFLKHPYYSEDVFFNVDNDPEDDIKVSFGFYWESILNTKTNVEYKSLEDMVKVRQINNGPSDLYAGMEVWSEIHVNWGLVNAYSEDNDFASYSNQLHPNQQQSSQPLKPILMFLNILKQKIQHITQIGHMLLSSLLNRNILKAQEEPLQDQFTQNPYTLAADNDYISVGVGYRTLPGQRIPQY